MSSRHPVPVHAQSFPCPPATQYPSMLSHPRVLPPPSTRPCSVVLCRPCHPVPTRPCSVIPVSSLHPVPVHAQLFCVLPIPSTHPCSVVLCPPYTQYPSMLSRPCPESACSQLWLASRPIPGPALHGLPLWKHLGHWSCDSPAFALEMWLLSPVPVSALHCVWAGAGAGSRFVFWQECFLAGGRALLLEGGGWGRGERGWGKVSMGSGCLADPPQGWIGEPGAGWWGIPSLTRLLSGSQATVSAGPPPSLGCRLWRFHSYCAY